MDFDRSASASQIAGIVAYAGVLFSFGTLPFKALLSPLPPTDAARVGEGIDRDPGDDSTGILTALVADFPSGLPRQGDVITDAAGGSLRIRRVEPQPGLPTVIFYFANPVPATAAAPQLVSATIGHTGKTLTLLFDRLVLIGAGGTGGFVLTPSGAAAILAYDSGVGTPALVYVISRAILAIETATVAYTQPGNGVEDSAGVDLANLTGTAVVNNSEETA